MIDWQSFLNSNRGPFFIQFCFTLFPKAILVQVYLNVGHFRQNSWNNLSHFKKMGIFRHKSPCKNFGLRQFRKFLQKSGIYSRFWAKTAWLDFGKNSTLVKSLGDESITNIEVNLYMHYSFSSIVQHVGMIFKLVLYDHSECILLFYMKRTTMGRMIFSQLLFLHHACM